MAKNEGPLFSLNAHGSIRNTLTYYKRRDGQKTKKYKKPSYIPTAKQRGLRRLHSFIVIQWQNMSEAEKDIWRNDEERKRLGITGFQYFLKQCLNDPYEHHKMRAYWTFNEFEGNYVNNLVGNYGHMQAQTGSGGSLPVLSTSLSKKVGRCANLQPDKSYFEATHDSRLNMRDEDFYFEAWINIEQQDINRRLWKKMGGVPEIGIEIYLAWGWITVEIESEVGTIGVYSDERQDGGGWKMLSLSIDRDYWAYVYINGEVVGDRSGNLFSDEDIDPSTNALISRDTEGLEGLLDEVCIYRRYLTQNEIRDRYKSALKSVEK